MKPGLHAGLTEEQYDQVRALRSTTIRKLVSSTPLHCRYAEQYGSKETDALVFGRAFHAAVLEPDRFEREWLVQPIFGDQRNPGNKARKLAWLAEHDGAHFLESDDMEAVLKMRDEVHAHPVAKHLITAQGASEVSVFWDDLTHGIPCKARLDRLTTWGNLACVVDFKTCQHASPWAFGADVMKWGYHIQAAFYLRGLHEALLAAGEGEPDDEPDRTFAFICVEKSPPYAVATYELGRDELAIGRRDLEVALGTYAQCVESGRWPGYAEDLVPVKLPGWVYRQNDEEMGL